MPGRNSPWDSTLEVAGDRNPWVFVGLFCLDVVGMSFLGWLFFSLSLSVVRWIVLLYLISFTTSPLMLFMVGLRFFHGLTKSPFKVRLSFGSESNPVFA